MEVELLTALLDTISAGPAESRCEFQKAPDCCDLLFTVLGSLDPLQERLQGALEAEEALGSPG